MKIHILIIVITLVCGYLANAYADVKWDPNTAISDAKEQYEKSGYSSLVVSDSTGHRFYGKKSLPQEIIFCALKDTDMSIYVHKVPSIKDKKIRKYVSLYNTEMLKLQAEKRGCKR
jgi:hypothetical protein